MSVRNIAEEEADSTVTSPTGEPLWEGNETHRTRTHPPEVAIELLQATDENTPVLTLSTHDDQDTISVRGVWVQDVVNACGPLGMGSGDGSTTTDGGQNYTPTVTGGGCPSDEPSEP